MSQPNQSNMFRRASAEQINQRNAGSTFRRASVEQRNQRSKGRRTSIAKRMSLLNRGRRDSLRASAHNVEVPLSAYERNEALGQTARKRWGLLRNAVRKTLRKKPKNSLTTNERDLLKAMDGTVSGGNADDSTPDGIYTQASETSDEEDKPGERKKRRSSVNSDTEEEGKTSARQKLRSSIFQRQSQLTPAEQTFLKSLASAPDVSKEALDKSLHVLERDRLYQMDSDMESSIDDEEDAALIERLYGGGRKNEDEEVTRRRRQSIADYRKRQSILSISNHPDRKSILSASNHRTLSYSLHSVPSEDELDELDPSPHDPCFRVELWSTCITQKKNGELTLLTGVRSGEGAQGNHRNIANEFHNRFLDLSFHERNDDDDDESREDEDEVGETLPEFSPPPATASAASSATSSPRFFEKSLTESFNESFRDFLSVTECAADINAVDSNNFLSEEEDSEDEDGNRFFTILGTSASDFSAMPHVMSPPLMDSLRPHMPMVIRQDNFWLKYSLVRDGASVYTLLESVRSSARTLISIETTKGEIFGAYTSSPWRSNGNHYFGSCEAFLWRMRQSRLTPCGTAADQARLEGDVEIFNWSGKNRNIQLANPHKLIIGGGEPEKKKEGETSLDYGFGFALDADLLSGTSEKCATFDSPGLAKLDEVFEISNLEIWTMTPVKTVQEAERLEMARHFVSNHLNDVSSEVKNSMFGATASRSTVHTH